MTRSERKMWNALIRAQKEAESKAVKNEDYKETRNFSHEEGDYLE